MELLAQLKNEDDNPRGQQQGRFVSGATLEEAAAAETRRHVVVAFRAIRCPSQTLDQR